MKLFRSSGFKTEKAEVVRIKVKKCDGLMQPEYKKFCVDPQLTSFEILHSLLARAFAIKGDFSISYLSQDDNGQDVYLSLLSDWDMDAAFLGASHPILRLKVDLKPFEEGLEDWDIVASSSDVPQGRAGRGLLQDSAQLLGSLTGSITGTITNHMGKTVTHVSKAMGLLGMDQKLASPIKPPMTDAEFHNFLDGVGHVVQPGEFRLSVYRGGVEPALRKVVWRHLLNVYPENLSGKERFDYQQGKVREYLQLREDWQREVRREKDSEEIRTVINMVKKDVLRTDRTHKYFAGPDDNKNVLALFNLLVTYAITHPDVLYCQGMSDMASPILMVQDDEANAYICFCGLMKRLKGNFLVNGKAMTVKFQHLSLLLQHQDPDFHAYLRERRADDLFFCYRWLLLEMKREFPLDDALYMLEVMWSSLPPDPPDGDLPLADVQYRTAGLLASPTSPTLASQAYIILLRSCLRKNAAKTRAAQAAERPPPPANGAATTAGVGAPTGAANPGPTPAGLGPSSSPAPTTQPGLQSGMTAYEAISPCDDRPSDLSEFERVDDDKATSMIRDKAALIDRALQGQAAGSVVATDDSVHMDVHGKDSAVPANESSQGHEGGISSVVSDARCDASVESHSVSQQGDPAASTDGQWASPSHVNTSRQPVTDKTAPCHDANPETPGGRPADGSGTPRGSTPASAKNSPLRSPPAKPLVVEAPAGGAVMTPSQGSPKRPSAIPLPASVGGSPLPERTRQRLAVDGAERAGADLSSCEEAMESLSIEYIQMSKSLPRLPAPPEFGHGNPFLMVLCLTLLVQHRDHIMAHGMDYNDLAMHFDKMVRKHNVQRVVQQARTLYTSYLKSLQTADTTDTSSSEDVSV